MKTTPKINKMILGEHCPDRVLTDPEFNRNERNDVIDETFYMNDLIKEENDTIHALEAAKKAVENNDCKALLLAIYELSLTPGVNSGDLRQWIMDLHGSAE